MCIGSISPPATNPMAEPMGLSWQSLRAVALLLLAVKLALLVLAHPFMDETYYFMWGQHPALSYFDHPSLVGWAEGVSGALFGWTIFGLRLPVLLTLIGDIFLLDLLSRHRGEQSRGSCSTSSRHPGFGRRCGRRISTSRPWWRSRCRRRC